MSVQPVRRIETSLVHRRNQEDLRTKAEMTPPRRRCSRVLLHSQQHILMNTDTLRPRQKELALSSLVVCQKQEPSFSFMSRRDNPSFMVLGE